MKIPIDKLKSTPILLLVVSGTLTAFGLLVWAFPNANDSITTGNFDSTVASSGSLQIPALLDYRLEDGVKNFSLTAQKGSYEFVEGVPSDTSGFNGDILGPTIRISENDEVNIAVTNELGEQTTSHWHGAVVPGDADGGVHNIIQPNEIWNARFKVRQEAATLWYHPHQHEETARQVYEGLGGMMLIYDEKSKNLNIPKEYGVDDIPVIIQSKDLDSNGKLIAYSTSQHDRTHGFAGNTVLINAQIKPSLNVNTNLVRLRILNGSNSDLYKVSLSNGEPFYVVASDGGFYNEPIKRTSLEVPNAKRFEILVDASKFAGQSVSLNVNGESQLTMNASNNLADKYEVPTTTNTLTAVNYDGSVDRDFDLEFLMGRGTRMGMGGTYGINGRLFDMERIDFEVKAGDVEYWKITNVGRPGPGLFHPFHVHATQFDIVEFNSKQPDKLQEGRHDTIYLAENDTAVIAVPFGESIEGLFLFHCHILEHEDGGMMGQFEVII